MRFLAETQDTENFRIERELSEFLSLSLSLSAKPYFADKVLVLM